MKSKRTVQEVYANFASRGCGLFRIFTKRRLRMKSLFTGWAVMTLAALVGCSQGTPGGPGTAETKPAYGQADNTFNLSVPAMSSSLKQEEHRSHGRHQAGQELRRRCRAQVRRLPQGVTVEPANPVIKHGDTEVKITFKAGDEALLGDFTVNVTGHPTKGTDAQIELSRPLPRKTVSRSARLVCQPPSSRAKRKPSRSVSIAIRALTRMSH